jgi:hypothetical protein
VLERFLLVLRLETDVFRNEKGKVVIEISEKEALKFGISVSYEPPFKWRKYQTSRPTETHF